MSHQAIEPDLIVAMNTVAAGLARAFDGFGFVLLVYPLDSGDGRMNYISNSRREDVIVAMKEFVANCEGRGPDSHGLEGHA